MLQFVLRKLLHKKWMVICLLIGNILLVSITCANPMYTEAVLQRMLMTNMSSYISENNRYPTTISMNGSILKRSDSLAYLDNYLYAAELAANLPEELGVPALEQIKHCFIDNARFVPDVPREEGETKSFSVGCMTDMPDHIEIISGRMYTPGINENGCYEAIVSQSATAGIDLIIGESFTSSNIMTASGDPVRIEIVGVYKNSSSTDVYWVRTPSSYASECFITEEDFMAEFGNIDELRYSMYTYWYNILDHEQMRGTDVDVIYGKLLAVQEFFSNTSFRYYDNCSAILSDYLIKAEKVNVTLLILQVPIFILLAAFIFMVSRQLLDLEQSEISILKSRGAGKGQIIGIYLTQSLLLSLLGLAAGIPLGIGLCQVLGSANAFLEFVARRALDVRFNQKAMIYAGAAALFSVCTMVLPVFRYSKVSIVNQKQAKHKKSDTPMWQKTFLDFILLGVSLYGLYSFNSQKDILAQRVVDGASLDPLLFMCSSLFILGAGLVAVRILPGIVWCIFTIGKKLWSPALYASFLRVLRTRKTQGFIMVFLVMTIALGIFNARAARTINGNEEDRIVYLAGTDIVLKEKWTDNSNQSTNISVADIEYDEPDFSRYQTMDSVVSAAKVFTTNSGITVIGSKSLRNINIMGINTKTFGETINFKSELLGQHINNYLNAISQNTHAVLLSDNFRTNFGLKIGDVINYKSDYGENVRGVIYGFVEYWPTYNSITKTLGNDGLMHETEEYLIVSHLSQLQASWGVKPYQIWLKTDGSNAFIYNYLQDNAIRTLYFSDTAAELVKLKNDPIFQGTNGILTVGFIVALLLCTVGFLIYWILSIQSRSLQFGIFRAMGMSIREIISMLLNEQLFISGASIAVGAIVGELASEFFIPLIQLSYAPADSVIPLTVVSDSADTIRLFGVVGAVILVCMVILGMLIARIKISQALKLGED